MSIFFDISTTNSFLDTLLQGNLKKHTFAEINFPVRKLTLCTNVLVFTLGSHNKKTCHSKWRDGEVPRDETRRQTHILCSCLPKIFKGKVANKIMFSKYVNGRLETTFCRHITYGVIERGKSGQNCLNFVRGDPVMHVAHNFLVIFCWNVVSARYEAGNHFFGKEVLKMLQMVVVVDVVGKIKSLDPRIW